MLPVVVTFCTHSMTPEFRDLTYDCEEIPFSKRDDLMIKVLYVIAKCIFEDKPALEDAQQGAISAICDKVISQFNQAISLLEENAHNSEIRKRTRVFY
ncbi:hypothetical protein BJV82DRAFT_507268 [Fennellomyces sp. T-0311]|nr:hypothetical protein BJV82DRAFT_507268 [Fennellomyces sp. T-0311]